MSICEEIKWHDNTGYYVKGKKVPKTVYGEVKSLERQLEEAREQLRVYESNDEFMRKVIRNSISPQMYGFSYEEVREMIYEKKFEQLKEKGDE